MLRWGADGAQHSWCASVPTELKSIQPISICAEYKSFVVLFSHLKWSLISDDCFFIQENILCANHILFMCLLIYLHSCWGPSFFFASSTARHWSPSGRSSRPLPDQRWRLVASPHPRCCCCPLSLSLCPSALHLRAIHMHAQGKRETSEKERKTNGVTPIYLLIIWMEM